MFEQSFGHYARILTYDLRNCVLVERNDFAFFAGIDCANLLEFCNHCKNGGSQHC